MKISITRGCDKVLMDQTLSWLVCFNLISNYVFFLFIHHTLYINSYVSLISTIEVGLSFHFLSRKSFVLNMLIGMQPWLNQND